MPFGGLLTIGAIGGSALANIAGGIIANSASEKDRIKAQDASNRALEEIERLGAPPDLAREIMLREYQSAGILTPEVEEQVNLGVSKVSQIQEAPEMRKAQMGALKKLQMASEAGMTPEARAELLGARAQAQRDTQAKMQQILQQQQQRGQASTGSTLAAQLQAASAGGMEESDAAIKAAAEASRSALAAAAQSGQLGTQIRGQEFDIERTKAGAEDQAALARFNEAVNRQQRNVAARTRAGELNLAQQQRIMDMNVAQRNAELQRQRAAEAQVYGLGLERAKARAAAQSARAQQMQQQAAQTQQGVMNIASGVAGGLSAAGQYAAGRASAKAAAQEKIDDRTAAGKEREADRAFQAEQNRLNREAYLAKE